MEIKFLYRKRISYFMELLYITLSRPEVRSACLRTFFCVGFITADFILLTLCHHHKQLSWDIRIFCVTVVPFAIMSRLFYCNNNKNGVKFLHNWINSSKRCEFLNCYLYLCHVINDLSLVLICSTEVSEKSYMAKFQATFCCSETYKQS